jgi:hypothetical protein
MIDRNDTYAAAFDEWRRILRPLADNSGDLPHLEGHRVRLETLLDRVEEIVTRQASLTAEKQEASRLLQALVVEGRKIAAFLKAGIRDFYGRGSEKVVEYGLQPIRSKTTPLPEEPDGEPTTEMAPGTTPTP